MGQYWEWLNLDKKERIAAHEFGGGIKYLEQFYGSDLMFSAIQMLMTDMSALGNGGGDPRIENLPSVIANDLIKPYIGRWAGDKIVISGDYTENKEYEIYDSDHNSDDDDYERFKDISEDVACAMHAMYFYDGGHESHDSEDLTKDIQEYLNQLQEKIGRNWEEKKSIKNLLSTLLKAHGGEEEDKLV